MTCSQTIIVRESIYQESELKFRFWVKQWMHTLFECPEDVDETTKNHTKAVLW